MDYLDIDLVRAITADDGVELRAQGDGMPTMAGHFSVFDVWYEVNSLFEGRFLERVAPGSFKKTFRENRAQMKVLFDHGHDAQIGNKVLGPIDKLSEDKVGAAYEVSLLDTSYNRDLVPGLKAGLYGASFRFRVIKDAWNDEPGRSKANPDGIPERTVNETRVMEFGPVTFPASPAATAGLRSLTDDYYAALYRSNPDDFRSLAAKARDLRTPPTDAAGQSTASQAGAASTDDDEPDLEHHSTRTPKHVRELRARDIARKVLL